MTQNQMLALPHRFVEREAEGLGKPVSVSGESAKHDATDDDVMEMRDQECAVVQHEIDRRHRQQNAGHAAEDERDHECDQPNHRRLELDLAAEHREQPVENFDARRNGDDRRHNPEECVDVGAGAHGEKVMQPDHERQDADPQGRQDHRAVAEQPLAGKGRGDFGVDAECRQDQNVDLGMAPRPKQIGIHHLVAAEVVGEEMHPQVTVEQQHDEGRGQDRERGDDQQIGGTARSSRTPACGNRSCPGHAI